MPRVPLWLRILPAALLLTGALHAAETRLTARAGWAVELLLQSPELSHPSVVCSAPDGRIFVAEDPMDIRSPKADAREGRILCRHPDGRLSLYASGLHAVFGLLYLDGRLFVLHNPRFSVFSDHGDHGEPLPDLIESTNPEPWALDWNDHVPANFRLGLDGFFYVATGDKGLYRARGRDGREISMRGGVFRIRPDGTGLETFSTGVRNILDVALTDEDELFTYDNTDEHQWMSRLTHMVDGGFYGWPHDFIPQRDYTLWCLADYGGGAATGALVYDGGAWPDPWNGQLLLADFGKRQVTRVRVKRDGATFRAVEREDLFPDPPADFRPVGIRLTADGTGLLICDWQHRDTKDQVSVGRLWRLTPETAKAPERPDWWVAAASGRPFTAANEALIAALGHPARNVREVAQRRLAERPDAIPALRALAVDESAAGRVRIHALWSAAGTNAAASSWISALASSPDPVVARQALRWLGEARTTNIIGTLEVELSSPDATRRFRAATALGRIAAVNSIGILQPNLADADSWVRFATFTALNRIGRALPSAWPAIVAGLDSTVPGIRSGTRHALRDTLEPELMVALARLADAPGPAGDVAIELLGDAHLRRPAWRGEWWAYHPANSPPPSRTESWSGSSQVETALLKALKSAEETRRKAAMGAVIAGRVTAAAPLLESLARGKSSMESRRAALEARAGLKDPEAASFFATELKENPDPSAQRLSLQVLSDAPSTPTTRDAVRQFWRTIPTDPVVLSAACMAAGALSVEELIPSLTTLLAHGEPGVRRAAVAALGLIGTASAIPALEQALRNPAPETAHAALSALGGIQRPDARAVLLTAANQPAIRADSIAALARHPQKDALDLYLAGLDVPEARVREQCRAALGQLQDDAWPRVKAGLGQTSPSVRAQLRLIFAGFGPAQDSALFQSGGGWTETDFLAAAGQSGGNEGRGRDLFFSPSGPACSRCHRVGAEGGEIGPDLTHAGTQFDRVALAESILFPSQSVREGYQQTTLELASGDTLSGLMRVEEADALTLRDAEGKDHRVRRADIRERLNSSQSLMPEGLAAGLSPADWSDLLAYLESLR